MTDELSAGIDPHMRLLFDRVPSMLAYWDRDLICRFANRAYEDWFGVTADRLLGTSIRDLLGLDLFSLNEPYMRRALAGERQTFERILPGPSGALRHSLTEYIPDLQDGGVLGFMVLVTNVTELKEVQAALRWEGQLRLQMELHAAQLEEVLRERTEMLNVMAHEVRQPLNNASAALQSAQGSLRGSGELFVAEQVVRARAVLGDVLSSLDNTLAVASLLSRPDPIRHELTEVDTLLEIAIADMPLCERQRIRIERLADIRSIHVDMSLMRLALRNLLSNALKFSADDAAVVIRLTDSDDPPALIIDVIDRGNGIAFDRLRRLFERATPNEYTHRSPREGMGLGLYIVRRVMELHGGQVRLVSSGPSGTTIRLVVCEPQET